MTGSWPAALLSATSDVVLVIGSDGALVAASQAAADLLGPLAAPGTHQDDLYGAIRDVTGVRGEIAGSLERGATWRGQVDLLDSGGRAAPYSLTVRPVSEGGAVLIARDGVDARERVAAERDRETAELFVARLGHELRTPLNAVLGFAQLLELEPLPADLRAHVERILTGGRHMQALLDEVLDLARVRSGGIDLDVGPVPVLEVAQGVVDLVSPLAGRRAIVHVIDPATDAVASADRRRVWQVLLNLVDNAVKYGREGGSVRVGVSYTPDLHVRLEVEDDGPGIAPDALPRLFRPFERLGADRSDVVGTGLGLALSQALMSAMGGSISVGSRPGMGTLVAITLPGLPGERAIAAEPRLGTCRVVHVSEDPTAQALVAQVLSSRLGVEAIPLSPDAAAPERVAEFEPALLLLDVDSHDAAPTEVLERLAGDARTSLVPLIALTHETELRARAQLRAAGAARVLGVPLDLRQLLDVVARQLGPERPAAEGGSGSAPAGGRAGGAPARTDPGGPGRAADR